jgi:CheY-like chemotaxis protein
MSQDAVKIRVLAVDDHPLLREGIAALIADETDIALVGEAADGREAVEQFRTLRPTVRTGVGDGTEIELRVPGPTAYCASDRWWWWSRLWRGTGRAVGDRTQAVMFGPELDTGDADATGADSGAETCEDT